MGSNVNSLPHKYVCQMQNVLPQTASHEGAVHEGSEHDKIQTISGW